MKEIAVEPSWLNMHGKAKGEGNEIINEDKPLRDPTKRIKLYMQKVIFINCCAIII